MALSHRGNVTLLGGEHLGSALDFWTITTAGTGANKLDDQAVLNKVIAVISLNGQPVIMGVPAAGSLKFAIEHTGAWTKADLEAQLLAHAGVTATATLADTL